MNTKQIKKLIKVTIKQSNKEDLKIFLSQIKKMILIPVCNSLGLNKEELQEVERLINIQLIK
tara:strand:- start:1537 stop:1722 length:186 start_codon:yes stop_codon:yes gene_type:complete